MAKHAPIATRRALGRQFRILHVYRQIGMPGLPEGTELPARLQKSARHAATDLRSQMKRKHTGTAAQIANLTAGLVHAEIDEDSYIVARGIDQLIGEIQRCLSSTASLIVGKTNGVSASPKWCREWLQELSQLIEPKVHVMCTLAELTVDKEGLLRKEFAAIEIEFARARRRAWKSGAYVNECTLTIALYAQLIDAWIDKYLCTMRHADDDEGTLN